MSASIDVSNPWFRVFRSDLEDFAIASLSDAEHRTLMGCRCVADHISGTLPPLRAVAFRLRRSEAEISAHLNALKESGLIDEVTEGGLRLTNWVQTASDNAAKRTRESRERKAGAEAKIQRDEHAPNMRVAGDTPRDEHAMNMRCGEERREEESRSPLSPKEGQRSLKKVDRKSRIAEDAQARDSDIKIGRAAGLGDTEIEAEWAKFRDHHVSRGNSMASWTAAWRSWLGRRDDFKTSSRDKRRDQPSLMRAALNLRDQDYAAQYRFRNDADLNPCDHVGGGEDSPNHREPPRLVCLH